MERARRKALVRAYQDAFPAMGVFAIVNLAMRRYLIGESINVIAALNRHQLELRLGAHRNRALLADWLQLGTAAFRFDVLERLEQHEDPAFDYAAERARRLVHHRATILAGGGTLY